MTTQASELANGKHDGRRDKEKPPEKEKGPAASPGNTPPYRGGHKNKSGLVAEVVSPCVRGWKSGRPACGGIGNEGRSAAWLVNWLGGWLLLDRLVGVWSGSRAGLAAIQRGMSGRVRKRGRSEGSVALRGGWPRGKGGRSVGRPTPGMARAGRPGRHGPSRKESRLELLQRKEIKQNCWFQGLHASLSKHNCKSAQNLTWQLTLDNVQTCRRQ